LFSDDELVEYPAGRVELERQPALGEVQLHRVRTRVEAAADVRLRRVRQVLEEPLPRVAVDPVGRVQQAQRGRGDHRLLHRQRGVLARGTQVGGRVGLVGERARRERGQLPGVPVRERDHGAVRVQRGEVGDGVGDETRLALFTVHQHGAAEFFQPGQGVRHGFGLERRELRVARLAVGVCRDGGQQGGRSGDATDRLGRNAHESDTTNDRFRRLRPN
jgi:hypothetical protein